MAKSEATREKIFLRHVLDHRVVGEPKSDGWCTSCASFFKLAGDVDILVRGQEKLIRVNET